MAASVRIYVQETFADIEDEFCDADSMSVDDEEELIEESTIEVDEGGNGIYHDYVPETNTAGVGVIIDDVEFEFIEDKTLDVVVSQSLVRTQNDQVDDVEDENLIKAVVQLERDKKPMNKKPTVPLFECTECEYKAFRKTNLIRHIKSTHNMQRLQCNFCPANFIDSCTLKRHVKTAHERGMYECEHCDFKSTREHSLKEHTNVVHFNVRFICEVCQHQATSRRGLRRHMKSKHDAPLETLEKQVEELSQVKSKTEGLTEGVKVTLEGQNFTFSAVTEPSSDQEFLVSEDLDIDNSEEIVENETKEAVEDGDQTAVPQSSVVINDDSLNTDVAVIYKCDQCSYNNKRKAKVNDHIKCVHQGVRFACDAVDCSYTATSKFNLKRHVQTVHEGIVFMCPHLIDDQPCGYRASQQTHLQAHIRARHQNEKFSCDQCQFECLTPHGLKQHIRTEHEKIRFGCHLCQYKATQKSNLKTHIKKIHPEQHVIVSSGRSKSRSSPKLINIVNFN